MSDKVLFAVPPDVLKCLCVGDKAIAVPSIRAFSPVPEENRSHGSSAHSHKTSTIKPIGSMGEKP